MFIDNKYWKTYQKLIEKYGQKDKPKYYAERHHIIPTFADGKNTIENKAYLAPRVHYLCHLLLVKCSSGRLRRSAAYAVIRMKTVNGHKDIRNSKKYEILRKSSIEEMRADGNPFYGKGDQVKGSKNHFYGKKHTQKTIEDLRQKCALYGKDNGFYGKTHSQETKLSLSKIRSLSITVIFLNGEEKQFENIKIFSEWLAKKHNMTAAVGKKIVQEHGKHLLPKYQIRGIEREVS